MIPVSIFQNFNETTENKPLAAVLHSIQRGDYRKEVDQVRSFRQNGQTEAYEQAKKSLPGFTPSGIFEGGRRMEHLQSYSGTVVLDFDKLTDEELARAKQASCESPYTYAAFTSPSGNGLKVLVRVTSLAEAHKQAYKQVKEHYVCLLGLKVDESGSDVTRLCFVSFDSDLYLNESASIFQVNTVAAPVAVVSNKRQRQAGNSGQQPGNTHLDDAEAVYRHCIALTERRYSYAEGSRNSFVHQLACNMNRYGVQQAEALGFLLSDYNFSEQEVTASVKSAYAHVQEHGTFTLRADRSAGQQPNAAAATRPLQAATQPRQQMATASATWPANDLDDSEQHAPKGETSGDTHIDRIEEFLLARYEFRYNSVTSRAEYRTSERGKWRLLSDRAESTMLRELKKAQVRVSQAELRVLLSSDFCPLYDPFRAYFKSLPAWDGETDHIGELAVTVTTTDQEQWQMCFRKWFVAMVAGVLDESVVNHALIVLSGGQGLGKTTWVLNLIPDQLKEYLYSGEINPSNKDTLQQLSENMLINLDELENLNRSEIGALKEMVTKSEIKVRRAYGHHHEKMPRRASFAGSVNTAQFLNDTTGSRRFLCFEVTDIDYRHEVDLEMAYAQALHLYREGFRFWFDKEEIKLITSSNERFQVRSVEEELLLTWFEKASEDESCLFLTTSQIAAKLAEKAKISVTDASANKLGKALRKHGFERKKRGSSYGYLVRELTWEEVDGNNSQQPALAPETVPPF
ncbi:VapE domain-containing protein [Pontibacter harenae]|uniref:VapE domain-containing protein n=1 Tax=Pontibacter harenae TaxID=2894083 RepID=UPI001E53C387|nr:VapE domain-containing protein [Pontibacter harenae]MCC9168127.1 DUF3874 domain-containing protein [Pontibacter harenae]